MWNDSKASKGFRYGLILGALFLVSLALCPQMLIESQLLGSLFVASLVLPTKQAMAWVGVLFILGTVMLLIESRVSLTTMEEKPSVDIFNE